MKFSNIRRRLPAVLSAACIAAGAAAPVRVQAQEEPPAKPLDEAPVAQQHSAPWPASVPDPAPASAPDPVPAPAPVPETIPDAVRDAVHAATQDVAQAQAPQDALARRVDAQMERLMAQYPIPGASIAVAYKGQFVYQRGYGMAVSEANTPATPQTVFRIASISKPVTAVAVLRLFADELPQALNRRVFGPDGLLPDADYPAFANPRDSRVLKITLRDLLQHTAGWGATDYDPQADLINIARAMNVAAPASAKDVIAFMLQQHSLDAAPGTEFNYSNLGYNILGRIIEHKTGKPYAQAVQELVFQPAGVTSAVIAGDKRIQRVANESVYYDDARWPAVSDQDGSGASGPQSYFGFHLQTMDAHGGWAMTAPDLVRFADAAVGAEGAPALLKPPVVALMKQRNGAMPDNNNGLGWVVTRMSGVTILSHSGAMTTGSYAYLQAREDGWTWAALFNRLPIPYPPEQGVSELQAFQIGVQRGLMAAIINRPDPGSRTGQ